MQAPCTSDEHGEEEDQDDSDEEGGDYSEKDGDEEYVKLVTKYVREDGGRSVVVLISGGHVSSKFVEYLPVIVIISY